MCLLVSARSEADMHAPHERTIRIAELDPRGTHGCARRQRQHAHDVEREQPLVIRPINRLHMHGPTTTAVIRRNRRRRTRFTRLS